LDWTKTSLRDVLTSHKILFDVPLQSHNPAISFPQRTVGPMKKSVVICVSLAAAFAVMADSASAQDAVKPRRKGFFETLFGGSDRNAPRRFGRQKEWWEKDGGGDINIIYGSKPKAKVAAKPKLDAPKVVKTAYIDPEVAEGLGMGNLPYFMPRLVPVVDVGFSKLPADGNAASAIKIILSDKKTEIRTSAVTRKSVLELYKATGFKPLWTANGSLTERGTTLLATLKTANTEGLEPLRYKPTVLATYDAPLPEDTLGLAQLDVGLSVAALDYAQHISGGAFEPGLLSAYHDVKPEPVGAPAALRVLAYTPFPDAYLKSLAPKHPAYAAMRAELQTTLTADDHPEVMAEGKRIRIAQKDPRVLTLRKFLVDEGYIELVDASTDPGKEDVLDKTLAKALKAFQTAKGIGQTSNLDTATVRAINGPKATDRRDQLITNMERLRWLPKDLGARHVFVNQASYTVDVMDAGKLVWESKVIVGRPLTQTAVFSDTMETVVFNPSWGVPQSILLNEYLPKLRRNPGYLDKIGFKVVNSAGKVVPSSSINWNGVGSGSGIGVQQPPGDSNALGELKFLFPNKHSIYMHDTPNRQLFSETNRNFSHGCVRVQDPREFASVLLGWDRARVDADVESGENTSVKIQRQPQVHLTYFTAWPDREGKLQYFSDAYGRDANLKVARQNVLKALSGTQDQKLVQNTAISDSVSTD
jgi:L,D-transpeptidase YcbB